MAADSNGRDEIGRFEAQYRENPDSLVFARLADACRKNGDPERALSILAEGIGRHPDYPSAHIVRARCLVDLDRFADAEASLRRVIELDAQNLVAIRGLANLAERRDDPIEAVRWYERIATLDPMNVEAAAALARLRPVPPPAPPGLEPLPAPSEEWWSSPAFQIEDEVDTPPPEPAEPVEVPGPEGPAREEAGTAWWFEDPGEDEPAEDGDLLTRTMAELYTKQGLLDEAAAIYRELLSDRPEDEGLRRALDELDRRRAGAGDEQEDAEPPAEDAEPPAEVAEPPAEVTEPPADPPAELEAVPPGAGGSEPGVARSEVDPFATHPLPATAGTGDVIEHWLRRLAE
ncbi:MAG: tetratricopeptide repeat protein [Gemmatimonadota bacterium]